MTMDDTGARDGAPGDGTVDPAVAPDGSPVAVYLAVPAGDEPAIIHAAVPDGVLLELGSGAGRITHPLVELGHQVVAVDQASEMLVHIRGAETIQADIETLDLGRTFDGVILGSHLVNVPDRALRRAFLETCRRHVAPDGRVLIERHDPASWDGISGDRPPAPLGPVEIGLRGVSRDGALLSATVEYRLGDQVWRQSFTAELLDDAAIDAALTEVGLRAVDRPNAKWVVAAPA